MIARAGERDPGREEPAATDGSTALPSGGGPSRPRVIASKDLLGDAVEFYREFVGLEELPPVEDELFGTRKYSYRHGATTISLRSFGDALPADTGSGGIQYVVSNVEFVDALAKARQVPIDQPLQGLRGFNLRTIWLDDPDGVTNYFAETAQARAAREPSADR